MPKFHNQPYIPEYDQKTEFNTNGSQKYIGNGKPGALSSEAKWQIYQMEYDASNRPINRRFANGNDLFDKVWSSRTTYSYTDI